MPNEEEGNRPVIYIYIYITNGPRGCVHRAQTSPPAATYPIARALPAKDRRTSVCLRQYGRLALAKVQAPTKVGPGAGTTCGTTPGLFLLGLSFLSLVRRCNSFDVRSNWPWPDTRMSIVPPRSLSVGESGWPSQSNLLRQGG